MARTPPKVLDRVGRATRMPSALGAGSLAGSGGRPGVRPSPSGWRVCAARAAARVSGQSSRRSHAPRLLPPDARAGPARRQPFPGSSPLPSSGLRAPRAPPQGRARARSPAARPLSARWAARRRGSRTRRTGLAALPAAERQPAEAAPSVPPPGDGRGRGSYSSRAAAALVRRPGPGGARAGA